MNHQCQVCGFAGLESPPRGRDGGGSYEICPSCGYQFGVDDDDRRIRPEEWRQRWIQGGMKWSSRGIPQPETWDPKTQLGTVLPATRAVDLKPRKPKKA